LWRHPWTRDTTDGIAVHLTGLGYVTWNLEYRRVGMGGGWPESFEDVRSALESARDVTGIGPERTAMMGHSAGGTMALWAGGLRKDLAPAFVMGLAAIPDLVRAENEDLGEGSVRELLGRRRPEPAAYSPHHRLPTGTDTVLLAADGDDLVPSSHGKDYAATAIAAGDPVELVEIHGGHSVFLGPGAAVWKDVAGIFSERCPA
jgi:acetyl esterase/lipase